MTIRNFAGFTTQRADAGDMVFPNGVRRQGAEPFSAEAWRGINNYADTLEKNASKRSALRPTKSPNVR